MRDEPTRTYSSDNYQSHPRTAQSGFVSDSQASGWIYPTAEITKSEVITGQSQLYPHFCQPSQSFLIYISGASETFFFPPSFSAALLVVFVLPDLGFKKTNERKKKRRKSICGRLKSSL